MLLLLRANTPGWQVVLFADDVSVTKGMVKYASQIPKESIVDVEGLVTCPEKPIESCSQKDVSAITHMQ